MFIPIGDDNSDRHRTPYVTYIFLAINILVFVLLQGMGSDIAFTFAYATVPAEILSGQDIVTDPQMLKDPITGQMVEMPGLQPTPGSVYFTLITSMFMHGGFAHLFGNMMYLWVFGDNLENVMGHKRYLLFYLLCGVIASMAHVLTAGYINQNTLVPSLGASGAISGILGVTFFYFQHVLYVCGCC
jgi:membrane associated rhomboid family serine protease